MSTLMEKIKLIGKTCEIERCYVRYTLLNTFSGWKLLKIIKLSESHIMF